MAEYKDSTQERGLEQLLQPHANTKYIMQSWLKLVGGKHRKSKEMTTLLV